MQWCYQSKFWRVHSPIYRPSFTPRATRGDRRGDVSCAHDVRNWLITQADIHCAKSWTRPSIDIETSTARCGPDRRAYSCRDNVAHTDNVTTSFIPPQRHVIWNRGFCNKRVDTQRACCRLVRLSRLVEIMSFFTAQYIQYPSILSFCFKETPGPVLRGGLMGLWPLAPQKWH